MKLILPDIAFTESAIKQTREDVEKLDSLISSHDAIFLLLDTRESRWLPTVMAAAKKKVSVYGFSIITLIMLKMGTCIFSTFKNWT